ncbi:hypothetical protein NQ317_003663 [Molorchus minor]|uniref:Crossover junction endonuclease MUS81 n=1 Tax=Molorchus minor TaxID=1323400 RepID=A0ABQ9JNU9_9CUCU|nr:hypothetical protein NQ317_003663 [Molorchus minor]
MNKQRKRITLKLKTPNPLFEKWIIEWRDKAKSENSKMEFCFNKALQSLRKYPVSLERGKDCKILKGFGDRLCQMLDNKLKEYKENRNNLDDTIIVGNYKIRSRYAAWASMGLLISKELVEKKNNPPEYFLTNEGLTLAKKLYDKMLASDECSVSPTFSQSVTNRAELIPLNSEQEDHCETLSRHSSSNSLTYVKELIKNTQNDGPLVQQDSQKIAGYLKKHTSNFSVASSTQTSQEECVIFPPDSFDIILYVDTCETEGGNAIIQEEPILSELQHLAVRYEVKDLKVGDYAWICRDRISKNELILPYIVERKSLNDFAGSIKDGRYHEQKFRLKRSGIQNITYLIEKCGNNQYYGLPISTLYQAATNTAVQDGFCVKFTESHKDTARYLANFSTLLVGMFKTKTLASCLKEDLPEICVDDDFVALMTFKDFNKSSSKNKAMKVSDLFIKMLLQINGMTVDRASAIVKQYPTPIILKKAFDQNSGLEAEKLLAHIQYGDGKKTIGPILSKFNDLDERTELLLIPML